MPIGDDIQFDSLLISSATILRRAAASSSANYGQPNSALSTTVATAIPCRVSRGGGRELKYDKKIAIETSKIYMNYYAAWTIEETDWIVVNSVTYNVLTVSDPSLLHHHLEIECEVIS